MDLSEDLKRHRVTAERLYSLIEAFPDAAWNRAPGPGTWSPAQVYGHIEVIATGFSFRNLEACLREDARVGGRKRLLGLIVLWTNRIRASRRIRLQLPPEFDPPALAKAEAREAMRRLAVRAAAFASRVAVADPRRTSRHFLLGWMNAAEWFRFAEIHSRHHLEGQLQRLLAQAARES